jgi:hypothetical protein
VGDMLLALFNTQDARQNASDKTILAMVAQINNLARQLKDLQQESAVRH